ncbi:hypothetical protein [Aeoliella sp.]|uniref:hypothetical protein n=1 Tax=Aeoliella sp. TaxID=2795800 RepID=UPI003CCBE9E3
MCIYLKLLRCLVLAVTLFAVSAPNGRAATDDQRDAPDEGTSTEQLDIKEIMRLTMTKGLCQRVIKKKATKEEQAELVRLFQALAELEPPIGDAENWQEQCDQLVKYSTEISQGKESYKSLKKAANCIQCHRQHRPK